MDFSYESVPSVSFSDDTFEWEKTGSKRKSGGSSAGAAGWDFSIDSEEYFASPPNNRNGPSAKRSRNGRGGGGDRDIKVKQEPLTSKKSLFELYLESLADDQSRASARSVVADIENSPGLFGTTAIDSSMAALVPVPDGFCQLPGDSETFEFNASASDLSALLSSEPSSHSALSLPAWPAAKATKYNPNDFNMERDIHDVIRNVANGEAVNTVCFGRLVAEKLKSVDPAKRIQMARDLVDVLEGRELTKRVMETPKMDEEEAVLDPDGE